MHNRLGVVCLKTNVVLGGVEASVTKRDNKVERLSKKVIKWRDVLYDRAVNDNEYVKLIGTLTNILTRTWPQQLPTHLILRTRLIDLCVIRPPDMILNNNRYNNNNNMRY